MMCVHLSNAGLASSPCHSQILAVEIKSVNETIALAVTKGPELLCFDLDC